MRVNSRLVATALTLLLLSSCGGNDSSSNGGDACGFIGLNDKSLINEKIIDGTQCDPTSSPVVEVLLDFADGSGGLCSGTMLDSTHVLTAAHCFESAVSEVEVDNGIVGSIATGFHVHPQFSQDPSTGVLTNDVAIIDLHDALPLPSLPILHSRDISSGDQIEIYGYGKDENGDVQVLRGGFMQVSDVSNQHILAVFGGSENGSEESDTCNGDSGGPAVGANNNGDFGIAGITSTGTTTNCTSGDQSLFTNLASDSVFNFILQFVPDAQTI